MFETSKSACLPLGGESAPNRRVAREKQMRVIRGEPVEVWLRDGRPARFVWRGRMYTVMLLVDWSLAPPIDLAADPAAPDSAAADTTPGGREYWLVEATPERSVPPTRYQLRHDLISDQWLLSRG